MENKNEITNKENSENLEKENVKTTPIKSYKVVLKNKNILKILIPIIAILILALFFSTIFALININNTKIILGVRINNILVSQLSEEEAKQKIDEVMQQRTDRDIKIVAEDFEHQIKLAQIEVKYDVDKAVKEAYAVGRKDNIFTNNYIIGKSMLAGKNIDLEYTYNEEELNRLVDDITAKIPNVVVEASYYIEDEKLFITRGIKGNTIDKGQLKSFILSQIKDENKDTIIIELIKKNPDPIDIDKIHQEVYKEPRDAYYTKNPFQVYPHVNGVDFDVEEAREILNEPKEEYEIKLKITTPKITTNQIGTEAFPNLLSTCSTRYDASNYPRVNNLKIAMRKLNGVVVLPGEVFSYNKTLGKRTAAGGYKKAGVFAGGRTVQGIGGGICQISSTLYDSVVYANLEIIERHNHMFLAGYLPAGKDATVSYGTLDFKFKNTRKYPIMIKTTIGSGVAKVDIYGVKENVEYEVDIVTNILSTKSFGVIYEDNSNLAPGQQKVIQRGMNGCKSITYKIVKLNGVEVSRTVLSSDVYSPMNKIIQVGPSETIETSTSEPVTDPIPSPKPEPAPTTPQTEPGSGPNTGNNPEEGNPEESNPEESNPEESNPEESNPEGSNPEGSNPEEGNPAESNPAENNLAENNSV